MKNYIKEAQVSKRVTGKYRKPENKKFRKLISDLNDIVENVIINIEDER